MALFAALLNLIMPNRPSDYKRQEGEAAPQNNDLPMFSTFPPWLGGWGDSGYSDDYNSAFDSRPARDSTPRQLASFGPSSAYSDNNNGPGSGSFDWAAYIDSFINPGKNGGGDPQHGGYMSQYNNRVVASNSSHPGTFNPNPTPPPSQTGLKPVGSGNGTFNPNPKPPPSQTAKKG